MRFKVAYWFIILSYDGLVYYWIFRYGWDHWLSLILLILYIWQLLCHKDYIYYMYNVQDYYIITLFARLYASVVILLTCWNHLHDSFILQRGKVWTHITSLARHFLLRCLYNARKVSRHVFMSKGYRFYPLLHFFYWILEMYWQCVIFCFSFYHHISFNITF